MITYHCQECGAVLYYGPSEHSMHELGLDLQFTREKHEKWHQSINDRINHATQVGAHADMMTKPLG